MTYRIAIPSFNRTIQLNTKTLVLLRKHKIDLSLVDVFLENEEQKEQYKSKNSNLNYIVTNTTGIKDKRNIMRKYYRDTTTENNIVFIDDDIDEIYDGAKPIENLDEFLNYAFFQTKKRDLNFWGVCGFNNPFYLNDTISTNLKYICGAFCGLIIDRDKELLLTQFNHYEDFEFSILHFKRDKGVVRFNSIGLKTKYFGDGGINDSYGGLDKRQKDMEVAGNKFIALYPGYARLIKKKIGHDLRLNYRAKP